MHANARKTKKYHNCSYEEFINSMNYCENNLSGWYKAANIRVSMYYTDCTELSAMCVHSYINFTKYQARIHKGSFHKFDILARDVKMVMVKLVHKPHYPQI